MRKACGSERVRAYVSCDLLSGSGASSGSERARERACGRAGVQLRSCCLRPLVRREATGYAQPRA